MQGDGDLRTLALAMTERRPAHIGIEGHVETPANHPAVGVFASKQGFKICRGHVRPLWTVDSMLRNAQFSGIGAKPASEQFEQGGLAATIRTDHARETAREGRIQAVKDRQFLRCVTE